LLFAFGICFSHAAPADDPPLKSYSVNPELVSVAGISSGAFMASQIQIAHSAGIKGAALIAGGLYGCAVLGEVSNDGVNGKVSLAVGGCMKGGITLEDTDFYQRRAEHIGKQGRAEDNGNQEGWIDPLSNLKSSKVYLFTGGADAVVDHLVVERASELYNKLGVPEGQIELVDKVPPAGHSWVTENFGNSCGANAPPFIDKCGYDQAKQELEWIYGPLKDAAKEPKEEIVSFDQRAFVKDGKPEAQGLANTGYLFVPKECEPGSAPLCKLQVVLHGCLQSAESLAKADPKDPEGKYKFIKHIGANEWADTNRIVVLYPQTHATKVAELGEQLLRDNGLWSIFQTNPLDCWNFWGYAGDNMFPTKKGVQVSAIWQMIQRITGQANN
jgi:hypothetical protein